MKIVIAPQAFKGSLEAPDVAHAIARGVRQVFPSAQLELLPIADGGEGTVRALVQAGGGRMMTARVLGPLEQPVDARWGLLDAERTGVIEMAAASGLSLIPRDRRDPLRTTTYGTGQLIGSALDHGVRRIIVGIGGSATNDGGAGMAQALGARFVDSQGRELPRGGGSLRHLAHIDVSGLDSRIGNLEVDVACDVNNPLYGPKGATAVYGPQKGANPHMVRQLDDALRQYARILERDLGVDVHDVPGAGAAGGLGAGLIAFLKARLCTGVSIVFEAIDLDSKLKGAQLVITGEGRMDEQDLYGKAPLAVAQRAALQGIPSVAIVGSTGREYHILYNHGLDAVIGIVNRPMPLERAIRETARLISEAALRACRLVRVGMTLNEGPE